MPSDAPAPALDASMLEHVQVAVILTDLTGRIVDCNRHAEELFGARREEIVGTLGGEFTIEPIDRALKSAIAERLLSGKPWEGDFRVRRRDGSVAYVRAVDTGLFDDDGRLCAVVSIASDVTEGRRASHRLVAQQELTRALAAAADLEDASLRILEIARERLEWSFGALWEVDGAALRCVAVSAAADVDPTFAAETLALRLGPGDGLPGRVWTSGEALELVDVSDDPAFPRALRASSIGLRRAVAVPVAAHDAVVGVLELFSTDTAPTDAELVGALGAFGIQLGQFLERRRAEDAVRASEARKAAMLEAALDPVVSIDGRGRIVEWNGAAERTFGWAREEALGRPMQDLIVPVALRDGHEEGLRRHLEGGPRTLLDRRVETTARRRDGTEVPIELAVTRVEEGPGRPLFTAFLRDISSRVRAEAERDDLARREQAARTRLDLLARLGDILTVDLDAPSRLQAIASVLLPVFADICAVITREPDGPIRFAALAHADPERQALIDSVLDWSPFPVNHQVSPAVVLTGEPMIIDRVEPGMFDAAFTDERERAVVSSLGLESVLVVPLVGADGPIGALGFGTSDPDRRYGPDDLALAEEIARRFAPAVEGAIRLDQERAVAETLQRSLLPERLPTLREVELAARYLPSAAGVAVGGDWYDVFSLPDGRVLLAIGDVVGHGVPAATVMGRARAALQFCALAELEPGEVLTRLNTFFSAAESGTTMLTLFLAVHDPATKRVAYANAGHPPPVVVDDGRVCFLDGVRGAPLGADAGQSYAEYDEELPPGATVVLYTDGLVERRRESLDAGFGRLGAALADAPADLDGILDHLVSRLLSDTVPVDDVALLGFRPVGDLDRLELTLPAQPRQLRVLRTRLTGWLTRHGVAADDVFDVSLAVSEAAANAVSHAYGLEDGDFTVEGRIDGDTLVCSVSDRGRWRDTPRDRDGRGLLLMHALTDDVDIESGADGTRVVMRRALTRETAGLRV